jgi:hypothetical protein
MKKAAVLIFGTVFFSGAALAQYETWRFPQKADEIQKMKTAKIENVTIWAEIDGTQSPYGIRFYDKDGRITRNIDVKSHAWYWYDVQGRMQKCIDSAFDGKRFTPSVYTFNYTPDGGLQNCQAGSSMISFAYNAGSRELSELVNENTTRYYRYNENNKLAEEVSGDADNPYRRKLIYNKYGDLASEVIVRSTATQRDSLIIVYSFDSKAQMVRKQMNSFHTEYSGDETMPATETKKIEIWAYTYAMNGTLTTEAKTSPTHPAENYKIEWQYDQFTQLPLKAVHYNGQNKVEKTLIYKYKRGQ